MHENVKQKIFWVHFCSIDQIWKLLPFPACFALFQLQGNITMDDVKKYGAAGTLSYVITDLECTALFFFLIHGTAGC